MLPFRWTRLISFKCLLLIVTDDMQLVIILVIAIIRRLEGDAGSS